MAASEKRNYFSATRIAVIALFATLSGVLYIFGFPISVAFPSFLELNFSDIPALIGTFALDPVSGAIIVFVKIIIKLIFKSTSTSFVGDLADLIIGIAFVVPAGFVYQKKRTFRGALIAVLIGTAVSVIAAVLINRVLLVPFYVRFFFGGNWTPLVSMMTPLFPSCTQETFYRFYLWVSVLPFNLMRCLIAAAVTLVVYKHISRAVNKLNEKIASKSARTEAETQKRNFLWVIGFILVVLILIAVMLLVYFLKG